MPDITSSPRKGRFGSARPPQDVRRKRVSRSGATILGAQAIGFTKKTAAEFSFFLAVPTMAAATLYKLWKIRHLIQPEHIFQLTTGIVLSFVFAVIAIRFFISLIQKYGFRWFGIYRIVLGIVVLVFFKS